MSEWKNREIILKRRTGKSSLKFAESILLIENKKKTKQMQHETCFRKRSMETYSNISFPTSEES